MEGSPGALGLVEAAVNRYLGLDPESLTALSKFSGKAVAVELLGLQRTVLVHINGRGVHLTLNLEREPDAFVRGTPGAFLRGLIFQQPAETAFDPAIVVEGDTALVLGIRAVLLRVDVDWEELFSHYLGDTLSHQLGNLSREVKRWGGRARQTLMQDMAEYLTEEARYVVQRNELDAFVTAVERLRDDAERLEQRVQRLAGRRAGRES